MAEQKIKSSEVPALVSDQVEDVVPFSGTLAGFQGEYLPQFRRVPWISIIASVGQNSAKFPQDHGAILYNRERIVPKPAEVTFYGVTTHYRQNTAYEPNNLVQPIVYRTATEVAEHGGNLRKGVKPGTDDNNFVPAAVGYVVLESPVKKGWAAGVDASANFDHKLLIPSAWYIKGVAFSRVVEALRIASQKLAKEGRELGRARWSLTTVHSNINGNYVWVPLLTRLEPLNSEQYMATIKELFGDEG
jgi:hypothetical protein